MSIIGGIYPERISEAHVVSMPFVEMLSLMAIGIPASEPSAPSESISAHAPGRFLLHCDKSVEFAFFNFFKISATISSDDPECILSISSFIVAIYIILGALKNPSCFLGALERASS